MDSIRGADPKGLEEKIKRHYVVPESPGGSATTSNSVAVNGYPDISSNVDLANVRTALESGLTLD